MLRSLAPVEMPGTKAEGALELQLRSSASDSTVSVRTQGPFSQLEIFSLLVLCP